MELINFQDMVFTVKGDTGTYKVTLDPLACTCRDFTHRKQPIGVICKHITFIVKIIEEGRVDEHITTKN